MIARAILLQECRRLVAAVQLMTRLPTPRTAWTDDQLARSARYFPVAGLLVGGLSALVLLAARQLWPQGALPALLAVGAAVAITGGLHEDGLADTADGLGGGATPARRLEIMRDSRIGTYGVLALGLVTAIRVCALGALQPPLAAVAILLCAHAGGRAVAVAAMAATRYAANPQASKLKVGAHAVRPAEALAALVLGVAPFLLLAPGLALACAAAGLVCAAAPVLLARRLVGGHTGDVLGAAEQAFEAGVLLAAAALA